MEHILICVLDINTCFNWTTSLQSYLFHSQIKFQLMLTVMQCIHTMFLQGDQHNTYLQAHWRHIGAYSYIAPRHQTMKAFEITQLLSNSDV